MARCPGLICFLNTEIVLRPHRVDDAFGPNQPSDLSVRHLIPLRCMSVRACLVYTLRRTNVAVGYAVTLPNSPAGAGRRRNSGPGGLAQRMHSAAVAEQPANRPKA